MQKHGKNFPYSSTTSNSHDYTDSPYLPRWRWNNSPVLSSISTDGVLRDRFVTVSDKQSFRGGGGGDLGQWGILRKAVPGEVHQRCHAEDLCSGEDYSYKDCRLRRHFGLAAVGTRHDHDLVADGLWRHCQFHRYIHQHWVPTSMKGEIKLWTFSEHSRDDKMKETSGGIVWGGNCACMLLFYFCFFVCLYMYFILQLKRCVNQRESANFFFLLLFSHVCCRYSCTWAKGPTLLCQIGGHFLKLPAISPACFFFLSCGRFSKQTIPTV